MMEFRQLGIRQLRTEAKALEAGAENLIASLSGNQMSAREEIYFPLLDRILQKMGPTIHERGPDFGRTGENGGAPSGPEM